MTVLNKEQLAEIREWAPNMTNYEDLGDLLDTIDARDTLLEDARQYITPTLSTHEEISEVLGWCDCGYCKHVPKAKP
jgi:ribosome assembly protein YihI (activator of Der GTPase)